MTTSSFLVKHQANFSLMMPLFVLMCALILIREITKFWWRIRDTSYFAHFPSPSQRQNLNSVRFFFIKLAYQSLFRESLRDIIKYSFYWRLCRSYWVLWSKPFHCQEWETITINLLGKYKVGGKSFESHQPSKRIKKSSVLPLPTIRELFPKKRRPDNPKEKNSQSLLRKETRNKRSK